MSLSHMSFQVLNVALSPGKKIYFASDFHLGAPSHTDSLVRERRITEWLESVRHDAQLICLVGDLFDFWFEHKRVVPRGFVRFLGKLGELTDAGIQIIAFPGNHDMWMTDYFERELNIKTYRRPVDLIVTSSIDPTPTSFHIAHGDGLGPDDHLYKLLKIVFESRLAIWAFGTLLHPNLALWLGHSWALHSWQKHEKAGQPSYLGEDKEWLVLYAKSQEELLHRNFYVFGHRHIKLDLPIGERSRILILGDWIVYNSYAVFDGQAVQLLDYTPKT